RSGDLKPMSAVRLLIFGTALASAGLCSVVTETEVNGASSNNTLQTAQMISSAMFTTPAPIGVFNTSLPTATIQGHGGSSDVDFYSFNAFGTLQLSIVNNPFTFSTVLSLFDASGDLLAFDDVSTPLKPGSASTNDSYIGSYNLPAPGTYFVAVSN